MIKSIPAAAGAAAFAYYLVTTGKLTLDTGWGRRARQLGPFGVDIAAPADTVFDVIAAPCLGRTPRALAGELRVAAEADGKGAQRRGPDAGSWAS